jgi:predicted DNA-binding transcriptional regulator AlpA
MSAYGYTLKEAASRTGIKRETIRYHRYVSKHFADLGELKGTTLIFSEADVEAMLERWPQIQGMRGMGMARNPEALTRLSTEERARAAEKMLERGMTLAQVAHELGYSDGTAVSRLVARSRSTRPR